MSQQENSRVFIYLLSMEEENPYYLEPLLPLWKDRYQSFFTPAMLTSSAWWIRRKVIGWALLDMMLLQQMNISLPECKIEYKEHGKPEIINYPGLQYNLSHSGQYFLLGLNRFPIGVDIEVYRKIPPYLAKRFFTEQENDSLPDKEDHSYNKIFLQIWTKKESYSKAFGAGYQSSWDQIQTIGSIDPYVWHTETNPSYIYSICYRSTEKVEVFPALTLFSLSEFYQSML